MNLRRPLAAATFAVALAAACTAPVAPAPGARVELSVAPLDLPGVLDVSYRVTVTNAAPAAVWTRDLAASRYGDASGDLAYVGPCDADSNDNTVTVEILGLYAGPNLTSPIDPATWHNPGPQERSFTCLANADVAVTFDLTVARAATQGFFDIAVTFDDIFCSAKLDCGATLAPADDLDLLHTSGGARGPTVVFGLACTADPASGATTHLYLDPLTITCGATDGYVVLDPSGLGNLDLGAAPNVNTDSYLFAAATYRGVEGLANKVYWNVALGLDRAHLPAAPCTLHARATAAGSALVNQTTPVGTTWPVLAWDVPLTAAGERVCTDAALDQASGVATAYTPVGAPHTFTFHTALASAPFVNTVDVCGDHLVASAEGCDDGNTTAGDGCDATCTAETPDLCGDGVRDPSEACDDANLTAGDGCSPSCALEDDPALLSAMWLWVKADAGVTLASGAVSQWADQSGNGRHFVQATPSLRPTITPAANNGYPSVRFEVGAVNHQALIMATPLPSAYTLFIAARVRGPVKARVLHGVGNNWLLGWSAGFQDNVFRMGWVSPASTVIATTSWMQYTDVNTGASATAYRAGRPMYTTTTLVDAPDGLGLNGYADRPDTDSDSDVLEIIVYSRALSGAERASVERYLATRYALEDPLIPPSGLFEVSQWLRADLGVTTVNDAGTARVSAWANQAGPSTGFSNTGAIGTKPVVTPNAINGHPAITLTTSQWLGCAALDHSNVLTAFIVARFTGAANRRRILSGTSNNWLLGWHAGYDHRAYAESSWISQSMTPSNTNWQLYALGHGTTSASLFRNGAAVVTEIGGSYAGPVGWTLNNSTAVPAEPSDCQVAEIVLFKRWLHGWEVREIERYLNARYQIY